MELPRPINQFEEILQAMEADVAEIVAGNRDRVFAIWQRVYAELTGEWVPLLPTGNRQQPREKP